jgi:hypothetical protein
VSGVRVWCQGLVSGFGVSFAKIGVRFELTPKSMAFWFVLSLFCMKINKKANLQIKKKFFIF